MSEPTKTTTFAAPAATTDPIGNPEGTIRGLLALLFAGGMVAIVLMSAYRSLVMEKPFINPDSLTIAFFFTGSTIIGLYFGVRVRQGIGGLPILTATAEDGGQVNTTIIQPQTPAAAMPPLPGQPEQPIQPVTEPGVPGPLDQPDPHDIYNDPTHPSNQERNLQVS